MARVYEKSLVYVRRAKLEDAMALSRCLRNSDIEEIWNSHHHTPREALRISFDKSVIALTVECKDGIVCMFGVVPESLYGNSASIWLLGSDLMDKVKLSFLKKNRRYIEWMLEAYPKLYNYVSVDNFKSLQWLRWLGASFKAPCVYGLEGKMFQYFWFEKR